MKRVIFIFLVAFLGSFQLFAANTLADANKSYTQGNYALAAQQYEALATQGVAPELYFNLANAYYKQNEIGRSILNYERALRLNPNYDDARFNLEMAQNKVVDNNAVASGFFLGRWVEMLMKCLSSNQWFFISIFSLVLALIGVFSFLFGSTRSLRKLSFYLAGVLLGVTVLTGVFSSVLSSQLTDRNEAIIMVGLVDIKSSPSKSGTNIYQVHEGSKVKIKSTLNNGWTEVILANGGVGWLEKECIERI